jgi:addiction module HigA family antidote
MSAKVMPPIHPGEFLLEEFLVPLGISQYRLAKEISVPPRRINEIVHGKRSISADTALRLARDQLEGRLKNEVSVFTGKEAWLNR